MGTSGGRVRRIKDRAPVSPSSVRKSRAHAPALLSDWPAALTDSVIREAARTAPAKPWDDFRQRALAAGVLVELAALGAEVMRESILRKWSDEALSECGAFDDGEAMIDFAIADPLGAESRWSRLLESGGRAVRSHG